ncbi:MAG TPA: Uma2 family endonuclease [Gemmatimonadaceae bacterium]|nr:MAG: hypothetical protein ABS52_17990 [Gemmatimonadetes bacterium SCN 70-22]HMN10555.1 Uma2 family endonuclease [Gemmatimonadaceae bacterium]
MTSPLSHPTPMTLEEYFAFDETVEARHEYVDGFVYAMTGGTSRHGVIASNVTGYLWNVLRRGACRLFTGNRKLRVLRNVFVPDVMVACGDVSAETDTEVAATYVVEVTSPSTERIDRGEKRRAYLGLDSLRGYLIVSQDARRVDAYLREHDASWVHQVFEDEQEIFLASIDVTLPLSVIYERVELPSSGPRLRLREEGTEWELDADT